MNKEIVMKTLKLFQENYKNIVATKVNSHYCYTLLQLGLRYKVYKDYSVIEYKNQQLCKLNGEINNELFIGILEANNLKEEKELEKTKSQFLNLEVKKYEKEDDFYAYISKNVDDRMYYYSEGD